MTGWVGVQVYKRTDPANQQPAEIRIRLGCEAKNAVLAIECLDRGADMAQTEETGSDVFGRSIGQGLEERLASLNSQGWWRDLLTMWRPAGQPSGSDGLRLAIRNGTMNFYRKGQSVAEINFDGKGQPYMRIHIAYVIEGKNLGKHYVRLSADGLKSSSERDLGRYDGLPTLMHWIKRADSRSGEEKRFIDQLMDVKANANVIDVEMGLPGFVEEGSAKKWKVAATAPGKKIAPRIDIVALEQQDTGPSIVLWEAKMMKNPELRCDGDESPPVFGQLKDYESWIGQTDRETQVAVAYQQTCQIFVAIHKAAKELNTEIGELGDLIISVAKSAKPPKIDRRPRVVIRDPGKNQSWEKNGHARKFANAEYFFQVVRGESHSDFALKGKI